ncbi:DUF6352 family protein [Fontisubflavum oceani]|uniref:DUF6352 family protein n=1 Tax=Fontisubflavum oceani TaxID=2978973 RepID=UPI0025B3B4EF|nr:DUF6352 family protein [Fontisubflavum oceani]WJY20355.1 DUF6352 family protein [Fontisubflavum oceani]
MREFWVASGHHLTQRGADNRLHVTDALILAWLARPEVVPPEEACPAELALYAKLQAAPQATVTQAEIDAMEDEDARENWTFLITMRDRLLQAGSIEDGYLALLRDGVRLPVLFYNQLVQLILRNALDGCEDTRVLRAAELFFRPQRAHVNDDALMLADDELVEEIEAAKDSSPLTAMLGSGVEELDVLGDENGWTYWSRSDAHTMVLPFGSDPKARAALGTVIERFVMHLLGHAVVVTPLLDVQDVDLRWFVGLDPVGTDIGNALWDGAVPKGKLVGIFALNFVSEEALLPAAVGHPVYVLLGMGDDNVIRCKPQNLAMGLPLAPVSQRAAKASGNV